jgi:hypothetical protein
MRLDSEKLLDILLFKIFLSWNLIFCCFFGSVYDKVAFLFWQNPVGILYIIVNRLKPNPIDPEYPKESFPFLQMSILITPMTKAMLMVPLN